MNKYEAEKTEMLNKIATALNLPINYKLFFSEGHCQSPEIIDGDIVIATSGRYIKAGHYAVILAKEQALLKKYNGIENGYILGGTNGEDVKIRMDQVIDTLLVVAWLRHLNDDTGECQLVINPQLGFSAEQNQFHIKTSLRWLLFTL